MIKASFVIPSYNSAAWLAHAIESCQKQTYPLIEIVVVDDGSTDSTPLLMADVAEKDKRIISLRNEKNSGQSFSRNRGNEAATGDVLLVLDADDIAYPDRAKLTVEKLKKADFVHASCDYIDHVGNKLGEHIADVFNREKSEARNLNFMIHSTCAYTKELAMRIKYRPGEISKLYMDDWAFQTEVIYSGAKIDFIPQIVGAYRQLSTSVTQDPTSEFYRNDKRVTELKNEFRAGLKVVA